MHTSDVDPTRGEPTVNAPPVRACRPAYDTVRHLVPRPVRLVATAVVPRVPAEAQLATEGLADVRRRARAASEPRR